ncbi:hypothetical protein QJQ45_020424 [Haematococcus lacustris]|nr:hypothetical protein QJQ45_020424 [Haematococcus lacustris]
MEPAVYPASLGHDVVPDSGPTQAPTGPMHQPGSNTADSLRAWAQLLPANQAQQAHRGLAEWALMEALPVGGMRTLLQFFRRNQFAPAYSSSFRPSSYSSLRPSLGSYSIFGSSFGSGLRSGVGAGTRGPPAMQQCAVRPASGISRPRIVRLKCDALLSGLVDRFRGGKRPARPAPVAEILRLAQNGDSTNRAEILGLVRQLEADERLQEVVTTDNKLLSATWKLLWTTEKETQFILRQAGLFGTQAGDVFQAGGHHPQQCTGQPPLAPSTQPWSAQPTQLVIDVQAGLLQNVITFPPEGAFIVDSDISLAGPQRVQFRFRAAKLKLPGGKALGLPPFGKGWFDNIYVDQEVRIARDIRDDVLVVVRDGLPRAVDHYAATRRNVRRLNIAHQTYNGDRDNNVIALPACGLQRIRASQVQRCSHRCSVQHTRRGSRTQVGIAYVSVGRRLLLGAGLASGLIAQNPSEAQALMNPVDIAKRQGEVQPLGGEGLVLHCVAQVRRTEEEWKEMLGPAYNILRKEGTERPWGSPLNSEKRAGTFVCAGCAAPLYNSSMKYNSGTGWPSFYDALPGAVDLVPDLSIPFMPRTEVRCHRCQGHLGHVFDDGPRPTGQRYCMNGLAMTFVPDTA